MHDLSLLTLDMFSPHLNEQFTVTFSDQSTVSMQLIEVNPLPNRAQSPRAPFSLLWRGSKSPIYHQQIARFESSALGIIDIFIVPVGTDDDGVHYEAVFN